MELSADKSDVATPARPHCSWLFDWRERRQSGLVAIELLGVMLVAYVPMLAEAVWWQADNVAKALGDLSVRFYHRAMLVELTRSIAIIACVVLLSGRHWSIACAKPQKFLALKVVEGVGMACIGAVALWVTYHGSHRLELDILFETLVPPLLHSGERPPSVIWAIVDGAAGSAAEEILFRGYLLSRLMRLTKPGFAVILSAIMFASLHYHQGGMGLVGSFVFGLVFATVVARRKVILPAIIGHFLCLMWIYFGQ